MIVGREWVGAIRKVKTSGTRLIMIRFNAKPGNLAVIQCYMPTSGSTEEEVEEVYDALEDLLEKIPARDNVIQCNGRRGKRWRGERGRGRGRGRGRERGRGVRRRRRRRRRIGGDSR